VKRWLCTVLLGVLVGACAHLPSKIDSRALGRTPREASDRLIIAAVDNRPESFVARAGSTPRGYDAIAAYGQTSGAEKTMRALEAEYGVSEVNAWPIEPLHMHCAVLRLPEGADRTAVMAAMSRDERVRLVEPLQLFVTRSEAYNDPYVDLQHGFQQMNVADAHAWSRGEGVRVAVIDTGADTAHPDLARSIAGAQNFVDSDSAQFRRDRHGTEVAGVIAAVANNHEGIVGVAPAARLLILKACWQARPDADAASCNSFTLARALVAALDAHAQIVNLSLTGPQDALLSGLIREGLRRGVLFVGAADQEESTPSLLRQPGTIEVTSSEKGVRSTSLLLHAPGREILTLMPGGHYDFATGDSIATAEVTGVLALLVAKDRSLSASDAYRVLHDTSVESDAALNGHVDACAALAALMSGGSCGAAPAGRRFAERLRRTER
jgi:hypothetical protein